MPEGMKEARATEAPPPILEALGRLELQLSRLYAMLSELAAKLEPIRNQTPSPENPQTIRDLSGPASPMMDRLRELVQNVENAQDGLTVLMNELDI